MATNRYVNTKEKIIKGFGKIYQTSRFPIIEKTTRDRYIFTREGDRLDNLAFQFYGDPRHWQILAIANNLGKGTLVVEPNLQLRIPPEDIVIEMLNRFRDAEEGR